MKGICFSGKSEFGFCSLCFDDELVYAWIEFG